MFSVGEKIVYPMHGAGTVEAIEKMQVGDKSVDYYKVRIISGNIQIMVPVDNPSGVQLRSVVSKSEALKILDRFDGTDDSNNIPWNKRHKLNVDRLKTGDAKNVADVLRELIVREKSHGLSTSDRKMFILTKNILCSELGIALTKDAAEVFENILSKF